MSTKKEAAIRALAALRDLERFDAVNVGSWYPHKDSDRARLHAALIDARHAFLVAEATETLPRPRRAGRPSYDPDDLRAARQALRAAGEPDTQANAESLLGWDRKTIQKHWEKSAAE